MKKRVPGDAKGLFVVPDNSTILYRPKSSGISIARTTTVCRSHYFELNSCMRASTTFCTPATTSPNSL
jgi:hypothetical protein